jgi:hypothetical protein
LQKFVFENSWLEMLGLKIQELTANDHFAILFPSFISFSLLDMCKWWVFIYQMQLEKTEEIIPRRANCSLPPSTTIVICGIQKESL